jgi:transcriptional regulator with XRE-family HTH domain
LGRRRRRGETVEDFADRLGIDRTWCGRILSGKKLPGLSLRRELRDSFRIPTDSWDEPVPDVNNRAA